MTWQPVQGNQEQQNLHEEQLPISTEEPRVVDTKKYYCPFLERGFCRNSTRCNFSHSNQGSIKIPANYCHFFLANQCFYGLDCKFRHSEPDDVIDLAEQSLLSTGDMNNISGCSSSGVGLTSGFINHHGMINLDCGEYWQGSHRIQLVQDGYYKWVVDDDIEDDDEDEDGNVDANHSVEDVCDEESVGNKESNANIVDGHETAHDEEEEEEEEEDDEKDDDKSGLRETPNDTTVKRKFVSSSILRTLPNKSSNSTNIASDTIIPNVISNNSSSLTSTSSSSSSSRPTPKAWQSKQATGEALGLNRNTQQDQPLCPYSLASGECPFPQGQCNYLHGLVCDLCCHSCLHPFNETQRVQHRNECLREHEREMELSFAVQRSKDKVCGICMDTVVEKKPVTSSRFGILEKCNHIFCLDCIRKWRGTKQFDNRTIRACPECRVSSDFVVPSKYWIEDQEDKEKLIRDYKAALRSKPCRYFNEGKGDCPFAGSCFYKHAYPDGRLAEMEPPKPRRRGCPGMGGGSRGASSTVANYILWNILTSTDDDDWSNDELESLYYDQDYGTEDDDDFDELGHDWM